MKIIITENQYRLLRRQSEIANQIAPTMDLTYEWLQNGQTYPLNRREYDAFISTVAMKLANQIAIDSGLDGDEKVTLSMVLSTDEIINFQHLVRRIPVADNVIEYAVKLVSKTRPNSAYSPEIVNSYIDWGAGPRASQNLILGAKANAAVNGKYSPDIEDVQAVAESILRHRILRNYVAEAEGYTIERIIKELL